MKNLTILAAACLSVLALAACGSSSGDAASAGASADDRDTARLKLQECLRKQGVDLPRPGSGSGATRPSSIDMRKVQQALQGPCKSVAQGAFGNATPEQRQEFQDRMAKFSSCMRKHGVDIPTFTPGQGPPAAARRIDRNDPKVRAAMQACRSVLPNGGRGGGPGGGPNIVVGGGAPS